MKKELYWTIELEDGSYLIADRYEDAEEFAKDVAEASGKNVRIYEHKLVSVIARATKETIEREGL